MGFVLVLSKLINARKFARFFSKSLLGLSLLAFCALTAAQSMGGAGGYGGASMQVMVFLTSRSAAGNLKLGRRPPAT